MPNLIRTQIYIPSDVIVIAKAKAKAKKMNLSQYIRSLLSAATTLEKKTKPNLRPVNFGPNTPTNIALTHNEIYDR